jgi:hypothetical protein
MTAQVERAWRSIRPAERADGAILAHNYGEASALTFYGRRLPTLLSGHLSWQYWHPPRLRQRFILTLGYAQPAWRTCAVPGDHSRTSTTAGTSPTRNAAGSSPAAH